MGTNTYNGQKSIRLSFALFLGLLVWQSANGQQAIFNVHQEQAVLNASQLELLGQLRQSEASLSDYVVSIPHISDLAQEGSIAFSLPGQPSANYVAEVKDFKYQDSLHYVWSGNLEGEWGQLLLLRRPEGMIGLLQAGASSYIIYPLGFEYAVVMEQDAGKAEGLSCAMKETGSHAEEQLDVDICAEDAELCPSTVDVLVLVTDSAAAWLDRMGTVQISVGNTTIDLALGDLHLQLAYALCNLALANSDVHNLEFRFTTVYQDIPLSPSMWDDVNNMSTDPTVQALRNQYRAHLVTALTNNPAYPSDDFGWANAIGPAPNAAYSIAEVRTILNPRFTLAHELAHSLGARHNRVANGGNDNFDNCAHGWRFFDGLWIERRTIMAASEVSPDEPWAPGGRLPNYSNPAVLINNVPTGTADDDNARALRNAACTVASYWDDPVWSAKLDAPEEVCCKAGQFINACVWTTEQGPGFPGGAPYTYTWFTSDNGVVFTQYASGSANCASLPILQWCDSDFIYIKVEVESADGQLITLWKTVKVLDGQPNSPCPRLRTGTPTAPPDAVNMAKLRDGISVWPNPTQGVSWLQAAGSPPGIVHILNADGRLQAVLQESACPDRCQLDLTGYPSGVYFIRHISQGNAQTIKMIKQ